MGIEVKSLKQKWLTNQNTMIVLMFHQTIYPFYNF